MVAGEAVRCEAERTFGVCSRVSEFEVDEKAAKCGGGRAVNAAVHRETTAAVSVSHQLQKASKA